MIKQYMIHVLLEAPLTVEEIKVAHDFRVEQIHTRVTGPGIAVIESISIGNRKSELLSPIDAYEFSTVLLNSMIEEFLKRHKLVEKSTKEVQRYIDKHELQFPTLPSLQLPTTPKDEVIKIGYKTQTNFELMLLGIAQVES